MATNNSVQQNIQTQLSLNNGSTILADVDGTYQFVDASTGQPISQSNDTESRSLNATPAIYQTSVRTDIYNYAKGLFGAQGGPPELVEVLATLATYYCVQSGQPVTKLLSNGVLLDQFMGTINNLKNKTSQYGYAGLNVAPNWSNNPMIRGSIARAVTPWDATGLLSDRTKYDSQPVGFVYYATDTRKPFIRTDILAEWQDYKINEPLWPA
jgi:hypothetical protein